MRFFENILSLSLVLLFVSPLFAETQTDSIISADVEKHRTGFSIGINDFPWDATGVSFRWWRTNGSGRELILNKDGIKITYGKEEGTEVDSLEIENRQSREKEIYLPGIIYYFLNRKAIGVKGMYLVKGIGIGANFNIRRYDSNSDITGDYIRDIEYRYYSGGLTFAFPIGIEHFFLEKYPNISYSLSADIYGTISLNYRKDIRNYADYYSHDISTDNDWYIEPSFGISPVFYIRAYF